MTSPSDVVLDSARSTSPPKKLTAVLLGNPNTGKTTLFNALSGLRQRTGNYPGVTVETKKGSMTCAGQQFDLIDLPGTYSLAPRSPDEMVAVDVILGQLKGEARPDVVISIVDASNLDRNLYLTSQVLEMGVPVVLAVNMTDVAEAHGIRIDVEKLSQALQVRVVPIQANKKIGLDQLRRAIADAANAPASGGHAPFPAAFDREVDALHGFLGQEVRLFLVRRLLLDAGGFTEQRLAERYGEHVRGLALAARQRLAAAGCPSPAVEAKARYAWIHSITSGCVIKPKVRPITWTDRLDRLLTHKVWGTLIFLAVMFVVFQSIFTWAKPAMKLIDAGKNALVLFLRHYLPDGPFADLLCDGVLRGVGNVLVFLPQILILFGFIAVLEDCGYMARAAFLMDKLMSRCGLSGKSFIPMLSSVACAVPGIMATRVIENRRDRLATILVAPLMSCSARLPVYILLIGAFIPDRPLFGLSLDFTWRGRNYVLGVGLQGVTLFCMYLIGLVTAPLVAWALKRTLLRGETPAFVMEMPLYKRPSARAVVGRMFDSGWAFLRRAGTVILATMVLVWALLYFPHRDGAGQRYDERIAAVKQSDQSEDDQKDAINKIQADWKRDSYLGRMGRAIEPAFKPLGWDWRVSVATLASFPAREVVITTLGLVYQVGEVDSDEIRESENVAETDLGKRLIAARWDGSERKVFTIPAVLSLMVFFALCCQCASTLAVIRRETKSWGWPAFTFGYMTALAYIAALVAYQVGTML